MKTWYRIICLALIAVMCFSFVACSFSGNSNGHTVNGGINGSEAGRNKENVIGNVSFSDVTSHKSKTNDVSMESSADSFTLSEITYGADEKFVYTSTVSFDNGVAAGLVFGAEEGSHYWVFNVDRQANLVKLLYFTVEDGKTSAVELMTDYFIGNDKMTDSERRIVGSKVANIDKVQLKVVITPEEDGVYAEFYADNIRRFGIDTEIELNSLEGLPEDVSYEGGKIGFNCFNSKVKFADIYYGKSD